MKLRKMLFVVGNSRSGTTMMGRILGNHDDVFTFGELHFFGQLWSPASSTKLNISEAIELAAKLFCIQREGYRTHGGHQRFLEEARQFCQNITSYPISPVILFSEFLRFEASLNGNSIPCDQTPRNVFYIDEILKYYPQVKIINMIRDPRDVLLSQKRKWKRRFLGGTNLPIKESFRDWLNYHPITISRIWHTAVTAADKFSENDNVKSIYFEKLLAAPEDTVSHICDFVGIDYCQSLLKVPQVGSSVNADTPDSLGINPNRAGNWHDKNRNKGKLNSSELYISQKINGLLMRKHNYQTVMMRPNIFYLILNVVSFPIKSIGAFLFNINRIKNIRETLKRRL
ncbi:sulfotransferase [Candidatus Poribacteria bacterium]|nr:sulfotransferase [Candidatus Poribacteria bacterium]MYF55358.1 sulfotransferase [Candidatus Poribacteria bacterium]